MSKLIFLCVILFTGQQYAAGVLFPSCTSYLRPGRTRVGAVTLKIRENYYPGGILASPSSAALTKAMLFTMTSHKVNRQVFTGIHALISDGDFMSLDGIPLENIHLDWAPGEPNDQNDDGNCLVLNPTADVADVSCNSTHPYFCRKQNNTMYGIQGCGTIATGYEYYSRTGSCYKFHRHAKTWRPAASVCHAEGGHLAIINSDSEAELIKDIFKENPVNTVIGAKHEDVAHVGFWKWEDKDGEWMTIHGETLQKAGYEQWGKGQPNNYGGRQMVGTIQRGGGFDDVAHYDDCMECMEVA